MTDQPRPAPKTQRPIRDDPKVGQLNVVIAFRQITKDATAADWREWWTWKIRQAHSVTDLDVAVHVIGAGGERSEHEGTVGL